MGRVIMPKRRGDKVLKAVRANAGIEAWYQAKLEALVKELDDSLNWFLTAAYRKEQPATIAMDRSAASMVNAVFKRLARRWLRKFDDLGPQLAGKFAERAVSHSNLALQKILKDAGWTVRFTLTPAARDALDAIIAENVGLIKSIAAQHLTAVQGVVMRSVASGHDMGTMAKELQKSYGVTRRRASLIARDQTAKANAVITRVRQVELGIKEAIWCHSTAGKHPRPSHVAMNNKRYLVAEGMYDPDEGRKIMPGELVNCRCYSKSVIPGF